MNASSGNFAVALAPLGVPVRESVRIARELGFAAADLDILWPSLDVSQLSITGRRELGHLLENYSLKLASLRINLGPRGLAEGADVDRQIARVKLAMEAARSLSAPALCVDVGPVPEISLPTVKPPRPAPGIAGAIIIPEFSELDPAAAIRPPSTPADRASAVQIEAALIEIGGLADRMGMPLAFTSRQADPSTIAQILRRTGCPWFGIDLDTAHFANDAAVGVTFLMVGGMLTHVRARDAERVGASAFLRDTVVGRGAVPWQTLFNCFEDAHFTGWIGVDVTGVTEDPVAAATESHAFLRKVAMGI